MAEADSTTLCTKGQILNIKLQNFMTFSNFQLEPTKGLNLVMGPNGSGKSSIMSAICLGLGGEPKLTGRSIPISNFIKNDCISALIEITLYKSEDRLVKIQRILHRSTNKSKFRINDKDSDKAEVERTVKSLNIQIDNLCQFMPQEHVASFAKLDSQNLLKCMLKTAGDEDLFRNHDILKQLSEENRQNDQQISSKTENLNIKRQKNERLIPQIQASDARQQILKKKNGLLAKIPLAEYESARTELLGRKSIRDECEAKVNEFNSKLMKPHDNNKKLLSKKLEEYKKQLTTLHLTSNERDKEEKNIKREFFQCSNQISLEKAKLKTDIEDQKKIEADIKGFQDQITAFENDRMKLKELHQSQQPKQAEIQRDIENVLEEIRKQTSEKDDIKLFLHDLLIKKNDLIKKLNKANDEENRKMEHLQKRDLDTYKAVLWLKENGQGLFKKKVHNPIMTVIDVPIESNKIFIENHISFRDMLTFVCEDNDDVRKLTKILREDLRLAVNIALAPNCRLSQFVPRVPIQDLKRKFQIEHYLKELFHAPESVMCFLCNVYNIHNTPVGNNNTADLVMNDMNSLPFNKFYSPRCSFFIKRSKYGAKNVACTSSQMREPSLLGTSSNRNRNIAEIKNMIQDLDQCEQEKQRIFAQHNKHIEQLKEKEARLQKEKNDFKSLTMKIQSVESTINIKSKHYKAVMSKRIDINTRQQQTNEIVRKCKDAQVQILKKLGKYIEESHGILEKATKVDYFVSKYRRALFLCEEEIEQLQNQHKTIRKAYDEANQRWRSQKILVTNHLVKAQKSLGYSLTDQNRRRLASELYSLLGKKVDVFSKEVLDEEIERLNAELNVLSPAEQSTIDEYYRRNEEIAQLERTLGESQDAHNRLRLEIDTRKSQWIEPLQYLIAKISSTFTKYFTRLGCVGEIALNHGENPDDFDKYGLSILVKFRESTPLCELSPAQHSGGECSVATIIFILSLQELIDVPFRCVDEINQGMDSINERTVFDMIAESAEKSSQYFLLTPKLLTGLKYSRKITTHIIYNGCLHVDAKYMKIRKLRKSFKRCQ